MNRLFDDFFGRPTQAGASERVWAPVADMYETKDELVIKLDLPGMNEKDIQVSITGELLSVKGQRVETQEVEQESYFRAERWAGRFERIFHLPIPVQADKVRGGGGACPPAASAADERLHTGDGKHGEGDRH
jgi:HSP20 family protein